ncbi:MAG: 1-aminocyclopropane-1-carboxylate deaminase/D-cysteine desulfhydrase [Chitinophagaceae bacterium]
MQLDNLRIDTINLSLNRYKKLSVHVLRLDLIHPVISGNKWFKLQPYLTEAKQQNKKAILTFGGAFSNHIIATAAACKLIGLKSIGIIRGEKPQKLSITLSEALHYGMQLFFISRQAYKSNHIPEEVFTTFNPQDIYVINEGGYGVKGMEGASTILKKMDTSTYTHICAAVGTGTMLAGLVASTRTWQQVIGISVLKNNLQVGEKIQQLLSAKSNNFFIMHQYHFGGYAKYNQQLIAFMNEWFEQTEIPSDFVYTGKVFFAINNLIHSGYFSSDSNIIIIHSGGLQGNRSLPKGTLIF